MASQGRRSGTREVSDRVTHCRLNCSCSLSTSSASSSSGLSTWAYYSDCTRDEIHRRSCYTRMMSCCSATPRPMMSRLSRRSCTASAESRASRSTMPRAPHPSFTVTMTTRQRWPSTWPAPSSTCPLRIWAFSWRHSASPLHSCSPYDEQDRTPCLRQSGSWSDPRPSVADPRTAKENDQANGEDPARLSLGWPAKGGNCHINWRRVCWPKALGELGVHDLERTGLSFHMRWLWFSRTESDMAWSNLDF